MELISDYGIEMDGQVVASKVTQYQGEHQRQVRVVVVGTVCR